MQGLWAAQEGTWVGVPMPKDSDEKVAAGSGSGDGKWQPRLAVGHNIIIGLYYYYIYYSNAAAATHWVNVISQQWRYQPRVHHCLGR